MAPFRIGLIGCGRISDIYLQTCAKFAELEVVACASLNIDESRATARQYGISKACTPDEIFADPGIDCVLNLTIPAAHAEITLKALEAGKHVYSEKPFVTDLEDGRTILALAKAKGLCLGNAPDTFFGGRWQTCRKLMDQGVIGRPTGVSAFVGTHGVERHNPNPDFYYRVGGGPLLDLGPYYLTAMVFLLGPIKRVCGLSRRTFDRRMIENGSRQGEWMEVEVDTHSLSLLEFATGVIGSMTMSFDVWDSEMPRFEIYGEKGTICIPDPDPVHGANIFQGEVWVRTRETSRWTHKPRPLGREHWHYDVRQEERLIGVSHYMSPKVWVGNIGLTMYHSGSVPLNVGLHKEHPFCDVPGFREVHTQIVGFGKMQQCLEKDVATLYLEEPMAPGTTHRPMYDAEGNYPWHQFETITPSIFMAVEMLPDGATRPA